MRNGDGHAAPTARGGLMAAGRPPVHATTSGDPETAPLPADILCRLVTERARLVRSLAGWLGRADAEDALQEAYLKALTAAPTLRRAGSASAWFERLARNAAIDRLRRVSAERRAYAAWVHQRELELAAPVNETPRACACVGSVLAQLPPSYRYVLCRIDMEGDDIGRLARELGITRNNARVRLHRARAALRARLLAVCGACAERRCRECRCSTADRRAVVMTESAYPSETGDRSARRTQHADHL